MEIQVTRGAMLKIQNNQPCHNPIVQVIQIKNLSPPGTDQRNSRFRVAISDGMYYQLAMLSAQLNSTVISDSMKQYSIIQIFDWIRNMKGNIMMIVIQRLKVLRKTVQSPVGNPVPLQKATSSNGKHTSQYRSSQDQHQNQQQRYPSQSRQYQPSQPEYSSQSRQYQLSQQEHNGKTMFNHNSQFHQQNNLSQRQNQKIGARDISSYMVRKGTDDYTPVIDLNPYQARWKIKVRVIKKLNLRTWNNTRGEGKFFSVNLLDSNGGEIRATMFNEAADKFYSIFDEGRVYTISNGQIKLANRRFTNLPHEFEITLNMDADVNILGEDSTIKNQHFNFCPISYLANKQEEFIDVIGIVTKITPLATFTSTRTGKEHTKRTVSLTDDSCHSVDVTLWGQEAETYTEEIIQSSCIMAIKECRVSTFNGISLNCSFGSSIVLNPNHQQTEKLKQWYETQGHESPIKNLTQANRNMKRKTFGEIKSEGLGYGEKADWVMTKGTITFVKADFEKPPWYDSCPLEDCKKKLIRDNSSGLFNCSKCNKSYPSPVQRFILRIFASDETGGEWMVAFNEPAEAMLGCKATELNDLVQNNNESAFEKVFKCVNFKQFLFKLKLKAENYQDDCRVRYDIVDVQKLDFNRECELLLSNIENLQTL